VKHAHRRVHVVLWALVLLALIGISRWSGLA